MAPWALFTVMPATNANNDYALSMSYPTRTLRERLHAAVANQMPHVYSYTSLVAHVRVSRIIAVLGVCSANCGTYVLASCMFLVALGVVPLQQHNQGGVSL